MSSYPVHTIETAPEGSKALLAGLQKDLGMVPNLAAAMSESPELLRGFLAIREIFYNASFTPGEVQVLALTNAFENGCRYCMALHSKLAMGAGVSAEAIEALRQGRSPKEAKLKALSDFSRVLVTHRGQVAESDLRAFIAGGHTQRQALEVVLGVAVSILPNFAHHLTDCALDGAFAGQAWARPAGA